MATIGSFTKDGAGFAGTIETLTLKAKITFEPQEKRCDNAPDYRIFHLTDDFSSEIGAAWKKTSKEGAEWRAGIGSTCRRPSEHICMCTAHASVSP